MQSNWAPTFVMDATLRVPSDSDRTGVLNFNNGPTSDNGTADGLGFATLALGDASTLAR